MTKLLFTSVLIVFALATRSQVWKSFNESNSDLPHDFVKSMDAKPGGMLWIGTQAGLVSFDGVDFITYGPAQGLAGVYVKSVCIDHNGRIWAGTQTGLSCFDNGVITNYAISNGLPSNNITCVTVAQNGEIWLGTTAGIARYNGAAFYNYNTLSGLVSNNVTCITADSSGNIWIGTLSGVSMFDGTAFTTINTGNGLPSNVIRCLRTDHAGDVWIGTTAGLVQHHQGTYTVLTTSGGLQYNEIKTFYQDYDGRYWIGYPNNGATRIDGAILTNYNANNGLMNWSAIACIAQAGDSLYFGCSDGILATRKWTEPMYMYDSLDINGVVAGFTSTPGFLRDNYSNPNCTFTNLDNRYLSRPSSLWVGGTDQGGVLHTSVNFDIERDEYGAGPVSANYNTYEYDSMWNRLFTVSKSVIDYHILHWADTGYTVPDEIADWPWQQAPWTDHNLNSVYEPHKGDYPQIRGDKAILSIFHDETGPYLSGLPLGVQVVQMNYSFISADSALANTVFSSFNIRNYSSNTYENFRMAVLSSILLGGNGDEFVGSDSLLSLAYAYNGVANDYYFGSHPPASGFIFLNVPMTSFVSYYPFLLQNDNQFYNLMSSTFPDGTPLTYGGQGSGGTIPASLMFSGDIDNPAEWSEISAGSIHGSRDITASAGPFVLPAGKSICLDIAFVAARDYNGNNTSSVSLLKQRAQVIRSFYDSQGWLCQELPPDTNTTSTLYMTNDTNICNGSSIVTQNFLIGGTPPYHCQWTPSAGLSNDTLMNPVFNPSVSTTCTLTVIDGNSDTLISSFQINVYSSEVSAGADTVFCNNQPAIITASSGFSFYLWSNGPVGISNNTNYPPKPPGTYEFVVFANNLAGCEDTDTVLVTFIEGPVANIINDTTFCQNTSITFLPGCFANHYLWENGDTTFASQVQGIDFPPSQYSDFGLEVWNNNGCYDRDTVSFYIFPAPEIFLGNDTIICSNATLVLDAGPGYNHYNWNTMHAGRYLTLYADTMLTTTYHFDVLGWNDFGCEETDEIVVTIDVCSGQENISAQVLRIYPNPVQKGKSFRISSYGKGEYQLTDLTGKQLMNSTLVKGLNEVSVGELPRGYYLLIITLDSEKVFCPLIIEE